MESTNTNYMDSLPYEMRAQVMSHLPAKDILTMKLVDRVSYHLISEINELSPCEADRRDARKNIQRSSDLEEFYQDVVTSHAKIHPLEGIKTALLINRTESRNNNVFRIMEEYARTDLSGAIRAMEIIEDPELRNLLLPIIASEQGKTNLDEALKTINTITDLSKKREAYQSLFKTSTPADQDRILVAMIEEQRKTHPMEAVYTANGIKDPLTRHAVYASLIPMISESGLEKTIEAINFIRHPLDKDNAYLFLVRQQVKKGDVRNATVAANSIRDSGLRANAYQWIHAMPIK